MSEPRFPVELIEIIILEAWSLPLSVDERITLMTSSLLVNTTWKAIFTRISAKDMHIPCSSYGDQYFRILRGDSPIYDEPTKVLFGLCDSLTFHLHNGPMPALPPTDSRHMGQTLSTLLYTISALSYLPNLRHVSIDFLNWDYDDLFDHYRLLSFPDQVTKLALTFVFDEHTSPLRDAWKLIHIDQKALPWSMPSIRHLHVSGAAEHFVVDLASVCPNVETCTARPPLRLQRSDTEGVRTLS